MERIVYRKTLDVHKNGIQFTLQGFETADNMARRIELSLMASGDTIDLPMEQLEAIIYVTTPYATEPSINKCTIKDNTIIYDVLPILKEGITEMQLKLIDTRMDGAKAVLPSPRFAVEVTKGNIDDGGATQTTTFTALEDALARAKSVYDARFLRIEVDSDCTFRAYFADGVVYETDVFKEALYNGNALLSQSYARGGSGIRDGEETDNSMYYSNVSRSASADASRISNEATELLEEARKHGVYTTFSVDFETGEVNYISPNYEFNVNKENGELDVIGGTYTADETIEFLVQEWLTNKSASIDESINDLNEFKDFTGKLLFSGVLNDGDANVTIENISKYNVVSCEIYGMPSTSESVNGTMVLQKAGSHFYGSSGTLVVDGAMVMNEYATVFCDLWCNGDSITGATIKYKTENSASVLSAKIRKMYGIC